MVSLARSVESSETSTHLGRRSRKHARLVERAGAPVGNVDQSGELFDGGGLARRVLEGAQKLRARLGEGTEEQDVGEVDVL